MVQNMLLYRSMRSRQNEHQLLPESYGDVSQLMGHVPILLVAGDFLQIKPAREISIADDLDELGQTNTAVHPEHHTAQDAILGIADVIHLTKSKRFVDKAMPAVMQAVRTSRPNAPLAEAELEKLRGRKIESCQDIWTPKYQPMESRAFEKASTSKLFLLQDLKTKRCSRYLDPFLQKKCLLEWHLLSTCCCSFGASVAGGA